MSDPNPPDAITGPEDLDLCWGVFLETGSLEAVQRVVSVLDWNDLTRSLIDASLTDPASGPIRLSEAQWRSLDELGLPLGSAAGAPPQISVPGDVDLLIWQGVQGQHEASALILQQLEQPQVLYVATKGAALWSLRSNAQQHPRVKALCEAESRVTGGAGRRYLTPAS